MKAETRRLGSITVLAPHGAVAQDDVEVFNRAIEEQRNQSQGRLVIDCTHLSFLDSRGIEALWDFADQQKAAGRSPKLAAVQEVTREILELTGVAEHFEIFDTPENAVRSFN